MKKLFISALCLATFWSCANSEDTPPQAEAGNVYMQFSVKMETTRSATDGAGDTNSDATPDFEVGLDKENTITKVDVVLANETDYVVATVTGDKLEGATGIANTYIASFDSKALKAGTKYNVYIYANSTAPNPKNLDATSNAAVGDITEDNNFWMTNAYEANEVTLPTDMSVHTQPNTPFNLGAHYVERSMARFDFMPKNNNMYNVGAATITLTEAALINQSKAFYLLRRVSSDGTATNAVIGGVETPTNFVVDTDYAAKASGYANADNFDAHMTKPTSWTWKSIATDDLTQADEWEGTNDGTSGSNDDHTLNEYYVWQYAKENTIPSADAQEKGITTGVVFKGEITGDAVTNASSGEMIFAFENVLYGNWAAVKAATEGQDNPNTADVNEAPSATLVSAYNKVEAGLKALSENATDVDKAKVYANAGFTGYSPEDGKYYAYYYYWNRHNDNGDNSKMGPMEFAVVRNNVYKLCVDKIAKLGHPYNPDPDNPVNPDPDPEDPTDPDEELNYYFNVTVKVLPWVVRVNHIEF